MLVVFIVDLSDDLLQDIFQRDQSGHLTVLVKDDGDIESGLAHFHEQIRDALVLVSEVGLPQNIADLEVLTPVVEKEIFHINNADDIVLAVLADRKPCELVFAEDIDQFIVGIVYAGECNMHPGDHDILGIGVAQIEYIVDHFLFAGLDDAAFMADVDDGAELFLGHAFLHGGGIHPEKQHDKAGEQVDDKDHRRHDDHDKPDHMDIPHGYLFRVQRRVILRGDLAEYKDRHGKHCRCNADHISAESICKCCGKGRCGNVYDIVAYQDGAQHFGCVVFSNVEDQRRAFIAAVREGTQPDLVCGSKRRLARREKCREHQKNDQYQKLQSVTRVHCIFSTPL